MIEGGNVSQFKDIFEYIPRSVIAAYMGTNYKRMAKLVEHTGKISLDELHKLSDYFEVDNWIMIELANNQLIGRKNKRKT